jgi:hypothetical protein
VTRKSLVPSPSTSPRPRARAPSAAAYLRQGLSFERVAAGVALDPMEAEEEVIALLEAVLALAL